MRKTYNLCFVLDKKGEISEDLVISNSLENLDLFIKNNFSDTFDVRRKYDSLISEFCLTYMKKIQGENKTNHNNRTGSIVILEKRYDNNDKISSIIPISVIYKGEHLLKKTKALNKIAVELNNDKKLRRLFQEKNYLLTQNEYDLIRLYFNSGNKKYKESAISFFVRGLRSEPDYRLYHFLRHLTHLCSLKEKDKEKVQITEVNKDAIEEDMTFQKKNSFVQYEQMSFNKLLERR